MLGRILGLLAVASAAFCQPAGTSVIAGIVLNHSTGEPVRKAAVTVTWQGTPRAWASMQTDVSGRFRFDALPRGQYSVFATKDGIGTGTLGTRAPSDGDPSLSIRLLTLGDGQQQTDVVIRLIQPASLSGRVTDADGEPLQNVDVQLLKEGYPRGKRELVPRAVSRTNDRGEYRFANVEPGKVYIAAEANRMRMMMMMPSDQTSVYQRQFYRSGTDWRNATPVVVNSGNHLRGIDVNLELTPAYPVRGRLSGMPTLTPTTMPNGSPAPPPWHASVQISTIAEAQRKTLHGAGVNPQDGTFSMPPVPPGRYLITASLSGATSTLWASQQVDVQSGPVDLNLVLMPAASIKGKVILEGESTTPVAKLSVELTPGSSGGRPQERLQATPQPDGTFVFPQVPPGIWDINVKPLPKGGYIKSMKLGDQDVLVEEMEIGSTVPGPLHLVVSSRGGRVTGKLVENGNTAARLVILAPEGKFRNVISFYGTAVTSDEGKFELIGVTPGKYRLYAVEMLNTPLDFRNPDLLTKLNESSELLEIVEGKSITASPRLIPAERIQEALR